MTNFGDLDTYTGDAQHDMWVHFEYNENTGELSNVFDDSDVDKFIDNLNNWN